MTNNTKLRVCILTKADPFIWTQHYVDAFRKKCDVITIGPYITPEELEERELLHLEHLVTKNDIESDLEQEAPELLKLLPDGWTPQLVVGIQSGTKKIDGIGKLACPTAYISIDTWHDSSEYLVARDYDAVFVAQREFVPLLKATGSSHAFWLPLACSPEEHHPIEDVPPEFDIAMIGSCSLPCHHERAMRLSLLAENFNVLYHNGASCEQMCFAYGHSKMAFNSSIFQDVNMRVFETMAMGCALLTNRDAECNGLLDLFEDGKHLLAYTDDNLEEVARTYLEDDEARKAIAKAGRGAVLAKHTYENRVDQILKSMRDIEPEIDSKNYPIGETRNDFCGYLPVGSNCVVDFGPGCSSIRNKVKRYIGICPESVHDDNTEFLKWPLKDQLPDEADTVVFNAAELFSLSPQEAIKTAWKALREGGTLLFHGNIAIIADAIKAEASEALDIWLRKLDFHLIAFYELDIPENENKDPENDCIILARKRTRTFIDVVEEVHKRHPAEGLDVEGILKQFPSDL